MELVFVSRVFVVFRKVGSLGSASKRHIWVTGLGLVFRGFGRIRGRLRIFWNLFFVF